MDRAGVDIAAFVLAVPTPRKLESPPRLILLTTATLAPFLEPRSVTSGVPAVVDLISGGFNGESPMLEGLLSVADQMYVDGEVELCHVPYSGGTIGISGVFSPVLAA